MHASPARERNMPHRTQRLVPHAQPRTARVCQRAQTALLRCSMDGHESFTVGYNATRSNLVEGVWDFYQCCLPQSPDEQHENRHRHRCRCYMELDTPKDPRQATVGSLQWPANVNHRKADPRTHAGTAEQHRHLVASPRAAPIRRRPALTASHGIWPLQERNHAREVAPTTNNEADEHWDIPPHRGTQHPLRLLLPKGTTALLPLTTAGPTHRLLQSNKPLPSILASSIMQSSLSLKISTWFQFQVDASGRQLP